jgi:hypothetical protein
MAFTQADLDACETAIRSLASGARSVTFNGRAVTNHNLAELQAHYEWLRSQVNQADGGNTIVSIPTARGW